MQCRKLVGVVIAHLLVVGRLAVHLEETVEHHHLAIGHKLFLLAVYVYRHGGLLYLGLGHLRGYGTLPYQVVQAAFLGVAGNGGLGEVSGAYGLVGFLGALRVGLDVAGAAVLLAP